MNILGIGSYIFLFAAIVSALFYMFSSIKESGREEQQIIHYQEIIREKEKDEKFYNQPASDDNALLEWLREQEG